MALPIEDLYRRYGPMVLRRCRQLLKDENQAVDVMHDVFVAMLRSQESLNNEQPAGLLLTTATNLSLNRLRSERRRPSTPTEDLDAVWEIANHGDEGGSESRTLARRILDRIFANDLETTRLMAVLHFVDGMSLEEVAEEVNLSVSGVRKRLRKLKERVQGLSSQAEVLS
jgi:RNA polymerase sigma-70 factor, ECF subfamily